MMDCYIFWHIYVDFKNPDNAIYIILRQWEKIKTSCLYDRCKHIYIGYVGCCEFPCVHIVNDSKVSIIRHERYGYEHVTTYELKKFCDSVSKNVAVLYFHNRGCTRQTNLACHDWTIMLEEFNINQWRKSIELLHTHHTAGCELIPQTHRYKSNTLVYHYSGNFWWACSGYIKNLSYPKTIDRYEESEMWILQNVTKHNVYMRTQCYINLEKNHILHILIFMPTVIYQNIMHHCRRHQI